MTNYENCYEAKEAFWNIWKKNKVCTCNIEGNEEFCEKVCEIARRHLAKLEAV